MEHQLGISNTVTLFYMAVWLAEQDSDVQARFFNLFSEELLRGCKSHNKMEEQMVYIVKRLDDAGRDVFQTMSAMCDLQVTHKP